MFRKEWIMQIIDLVHIIVLGAYLYVLKRQLRFFNAKWSLGLKWTLSLKSFTYSLISLLVLCLVTLTLAVIEEI